MIRLRCEKMTVEELIERLKEMPQDKPVYVFINGEEEKACGVCEVSAFDNVDNVECVEIISE